MMLATEMVTFYHLNDGEITLKMVLNGVTWREKSITGTSDKGLSISKAVIVRVPVESAPDGFSPAVGDMLVHGACNVGLGESDIALATAGAATVQTVSNNMQGHMPHYKLEAV